MMDASYLVAALLCGIPAFLAARVVRQFHWDSEAARRARSFDGDTLPDDDTHGTGPRAGTEPEPYSYRHGNGWYLDQYRNRESRRGTVPGDNVGPRPGRHALGRDLDFANAQAVGGYDLDGD